MAAVKLSTKAVGSIVKIKENGKFVDYIVIHQGLPSSMYDASCNGTWLLRKEIVTIMQWHTSDYNSYEGSAIHSYVNSTFLNQIEATIRNAIKQIKIPYRPGTGGFNVSSGADGLSCKLFLLGAREIGWTLAGDVDCPSDGVKLAYFELGRETSANNKRIAYFNGKAESWGCRTPNPDRVKGVWSARETGEFTIQAKATNSVGVRPAFIAATSLWVFDDGTVSSNAVPSAPGSITVPDSAKGGSTLKITWTAASDPDGNLSGYRLERQVNGGSWAQIYQGTALTYTDTITKGWTSVAYRVRAYDSGGLTSGYKTSATRTVFNNNAPTTPGSITVPAQVRGGKSCKVDWAASTDADSNLAGYRLQRQVDGGAWTQIYQGTARTYTDTITRGWKTVVYRVCAYDSENAASGWKTAPSRAVVNNLAPTISGADGALGAKTAAFTQTYTCSDDDGDRISVTEKLDQTIIRSFTATAGAQNTLTVDAARFQKLLNGSHTLTVTATDGQGGSTTRTWTFTKSITRLSVQFQQPLAADARPERCIVHVTGAIPPDAVYLVEVCNNGNDAQPVWEDCTNSVKAGRKFTFLNTSKTAQKWGFNVRVTLDRAGTVGDCYISAVGGNFE